MEPTIENQTSETYQPMRPQFLSVLCILTWVCCAMIFISTLIGAVFQPTPEKRLEQIEEMRKISPEAADKMEAVLEEQSPGIQIVSTVLSLIAVALCTYGAILMWQLKRKGFYWYLLGEFLPYIGFVLGGVEALSAAGSMTGMGSGFTTIAVGMMIFFDLLFIVFYGTNLKHMKSPA